MRSALQTSAVTSEQVARKLIINTGARANLSNVEVLVRASWGPRNLILLVYDVTSLTA